MELKWIGVFLRDRVLPIRRYAIRSPAPSCRGGLAPAANWQARLQPDSSDRQPRPGRIRIQPARRTRNNALGSIRRHVLGVTGTHTSA